MSTEPATSVLRGSGWVPAREASELLDVGPGHVRWLVDNGHLPSVSYIGNQRWVLRTDVETLIAERARWVSYVEAARIIGCSAATVTKLVHEGRFEQRGAGTTALASLSRESVERVAQERAQEEAERRARGLERSPNAPPDDDHDWISVPVAAELLGITANGVRWMCENERVPAVRRGSRWWLRRDLVILAHNARAARDDLVLRADGTLGGSLDCDQVSSGGNGG